MKPSGEPTRLLEAAWDDGAAVYDTRSGDTHLLDEFTLTVLHAARHAGSNARDIAPLLPHGAESPSLLLSRIESALDQLLAARLL